MGARVNCFSKSPARSVKRFFTGHTPVKTKHYLNNEYSYSICISREFVFALPCDMRYYLSCVQLDTSVLRIRVYSAYFYEILRSVAIPAFLQYFHGKCATTSVSDLVPPIRMFERETMLSAGPHPYTIALLRCRAIPTAHSTYCKSLELLV